MNYFKLYFQNFIILLFILIIHLPLLIFGDFQQDDFYIFNLSKYNFIGSFSEVILQFSNRPFAAIFFSFITRFFSSYEFFYILNIVLILLSCNFIIVSFKKYFIKAFFKEIFIIFCLIPVFSYSVIFSPGMQITGNLSVFIWSISIFYLNKYLKENSLRQLIFSNLYLTLMFLTYESAFPLLIVNLIMPFLQNNAKRFRNVFMTITIVLIISFILQKIILPEIFNRDISRLRIENFQIKSFLLFFSGNIILFLNIFYLLFANFFSNLKIIFGSYFLIFQYLTCLILFIFTCYKAYQTKSNTTEKYRERIFILLITVVFFIFLLIFMHTISKSAMNFYGINNRALVSLSFFFPFFLIILFNNMPKRYFIILFFPFFIVITNYLPIQYNNIIYIKERNLSFQNLISESKKNFTHSIFLVFYDNFDSNNLFKYTTYSDDNFDFQNMINFKETIYKNKNNIEGGNFTKAMYCNKVFWKQHFDDRFHTKFNDKKKIIFAENIKNKIIFNKFENYNNFNNFIKNKIFCNNKNKYKDFLNNKFNKSSNKDFINNSKFVMKILDFYMNLSN